MSSSERLLALYDEKMLHCCRMCKAIDHEVEIVKSSYDMGILKSKRMLHYYVKRAENKKQEFMNQFDEYYRQMVFIQSQRSILL